MEMEMEMEMERMGEREMSACDVCGTRRKESVSEQSEGLNLRHV